MTQLLTIEAAAESLSISKAHMYRLVQGRKIQHYRIGKRCVRFSPEQIHKFLEARRGR